MITTTTRSAAQSGQREGDERTTDFEKKGEESSNSKSNDMASHQARGSRHDFRLWTERRVRDGSRLPSDFFDDLAFIKGLASDSLFHNQADEAESKKPLAKSHAEPRRGGHQTQLPPRRSAPVATTEEEVNEEMGPFQSSEERPQEQIGEIIVDVTEQSERSESPRNLDEQMELLRSVRDLETKLLQAKAALARALDTEPSATSKSDTNMTPPPTSSPVPSSSPITAKEPEVRVEGKVSKKQPPIRLTKEDFINLVDLYFYSQNTVNSPESTDSSPNPLFLDDHSFRLSADFSRGAEEPRVNEDETYESPLKQIEEMLKHNKLKEISAMQVFVDLLLDDDSSNRALYEAFLQLPRPGVSFLPTGVLRLLLQRMSTPWTKSEKSMLRYLSLIDDMQREKLHITQAEWSSAVYLGGRSFARATESDVNQAFDIWRRMEHDAGVTAGHVTFNILFDVAVRAGKFALGETILGEMHQRNLRLNRLGRVSLIYYQGLRGDGDGVRKTYRDFVEAGEIVDTVVLNCVIASLYNAQEPTAAEQIYQRMKNLQSQMQKTVDADGRTILFKRYPGLDSNQINHEMASNQLGRILQRAPHLRNVLPDHHTHLQNIMPLTPDFTTFRTMLSYHASTSGDLDRISVLLNDMTDVFHIPLNVFVFQFLFKGFAIHGPKGGPDTPWSRKRLDLCWEACRDSIKQSRVYARTRDDRPTLPSIREVNALNEIATSKRLLAKARKNREVPALTAWHEFIADLAIYPRERVKKIKRFHSQEPDDTALVADEDNVSSSSETSSNIELSSDFGDNQSQEFNSPFFEPASYYTAPNPQLDHEEGEYVLPSPIRSTIADANRRPLPSQLGDATGNPIDADTNYLGEEQEGEDEEEYVDEHKEDSPLREGIYATRPLMCWLLRAYSRCTGDRQKVEEIWNSARKIWKPKDPEEKASVARVLGRCLLDCDRMNGGQH